MNEYREDYEREELEDPTPDPEEDGGEEGTRLNLTPEEIEELEEITDEAANEKIEQEKISRFQDALETQLPGIKGRLPEKDYYTSLDEYRESVEEIVEEAESERRAKIADAEIVGEAVARRVRGPQTPDEAIVARYGGALTPEDWRKIQSGHDMGVKVAEFAEKAREAELQGDHKEAGTWRQRMAYLERDLERVAPLDAVEGERKQLLDMAEKAIEANPESPGTIEAFNRESDGHHLYLLRSDLEGSPYLKGARLPGDEAVIKVDLGNLEAKSVFQAAKDHNTPLADFALKKGFVTLEKVASGPKKAPEPEKDPNKMTYSEYVRWRRG